MPDRIECPRDGRPLTWRDVAAVHMVDAGLPAGIGERAGRLVYRCRCGLLCVVEGESVTWYAPMGELDAAKSHASKALVDLLDLDQRNGNIECALGHLRAAMLVGKPEVRSE